MPLPKRQTVPTSRASKNSSTTDDSRFANFETDPKFRLPSKKHTRTKLDPRFARLRNDPDFYSKASVDRYGRKIPKDAGKKNVERFYDVEDEELDEGAPQERKRDKAVLKELAKVEKQGFDPIRDGGLSSSSDDSSSEEEDEEIEEQAELAPQGTDVPTGEVTARLAAVNMDWDNIRSSDIMAVANSFVPADGRILNVVVYPSEFGIERLQREEIEGPPREIFASTANKNKDNLTSLKEVTAESASDGDESDGEPKESTGEEFDSKALRNYQLDRLRYYYAIITCSSAKVAKSIYDNLDGREYLSSANFFDLRFVPNDTSFDEDPRDECEELPDDYKPNEFSTDALTHSKVRLTWDADDTTRQEVQKRAFSRKEIDENELQAYLGSDSSSSEDEAEVNKAEKAANLRAALGLDAVSKTSKSKARSSSKRERGLTQPSGEMQITFSAGLSADAGKGSVFENEPPTDETTLEKYQRKQRERKARRKEKKAMNEGRESNAEQVDETLGNAKDNDDPWNDPFFGSDEETATKSFKESKKAQRAKKREDREKAERESAAERAKLELLMADDEASKVQHFDMNEIEKAEKAKKKKGKKGKKAPAVEDDFEINVKDPRFAKLYESHDFAIDPTNPRYKDTKAMKALLEEGRKKRRRESGDQPEDEVQKPKKKLATEGDDLKKLAVKVKAKSKRK